MKRAKTTAGRMQILAISMISILSSFFIGVQTAGDVKTVSQTAALGEQYETGDINGDGMTDVQDVIAILEMIQNGTSPSAEQLNGDPDADGFLTIEDAVRILQNDIPHS